VGNAAFRLYRVADVNTKRQYTTVFPFEDMSSDPEVLVEMLLSLRDRVTQSGVPADEILITDAEGYASAMDLAPGAWLLICDPVHAGHLTHYVEPQLILLPREDQPGQLTTELEIYPKSTVLDRNAVLEVQKVVKTWDDAGYEAQRPKSITVRLLKNGQVMDTVVLSEENNWQYVWMDLIPVADWSVEEEVPQGYTPEVQESDGVYSLVNHRRDIPQTGHIWWPVALALAGGFLLVVLGVLIKRSDRHES
jgi:hypothetical protein